MNTRIFSAIAASVLLLGSARPRAIANQPSEFDETAIRAMQEGRSASQAFTIGVQAFEASSDPVVKATKWEEAVVASSDGLLSVIWPPPPGGWTLLDFSAGAELTLHDVQDQQSQKASCTKLVAHNEVEAVQLRAAGGLILVAVLDGEQWGEKLLLDIARRPDNNIKWLTYWFAKDFARDWHTQGEAASGAPVWSVNWSSWQQTYNTANALGKAIILRNVTTLALRRGEVVTAAAINLAALSGTDRELKAIALAFGDPALGSAVIAKWAKIAGDASDPQLQILAKEVRAKFGTTN